MSKRLFKDIVFAVVKSIPQGQVLTYKEVAKLSGSPRAYRAVGTILKSNYNTLIPCHRVVKSDGSLGDYNRGGTKAKENILKIERVIL